MTTILCFWTMRQSFFSGKYRTTKPALVPKPRVNLTRFHGVFAPNSQHRALITPVRRGRGNKAKILKEPQTPAARRASMTWAQRLKRVFDIDMEACSECGGAVKVIACIEDTVVIKTILSHLQTKPKPPHCPRVGRRRPVCSADSQNRLFDARSCAASPWQGHGLPDAQDGAMGAEKAGKYPASGMVFGVNSGHRTVKKKRSADGKRPLDLGKKGVYSSYTQHSFLQLRNLRYMLLSVQGKSSCIRGGCNTANTNTLQGGCDMTSKRLYKVTPLVNARIIFALFFLIPLCACANVPTTNTPMFSDKDNNSRVAVAANTIFEIRLTASLGTGYSWRLGTLDESIVSSLGDKLMPKPPAKDPQVGMHDTQVFTFKTVKQGKTTITFNHARPWEKEVAPAKTYSITIEVK